MKNSGITEYFEEVQKADYLLSVKDNHPNLKKDIEDYIQDRGLQKTMDKISQSEKGHGRIEKRIAFITDKIDWLQQRKEWRGITSIGAIHTETESKKEKSSEWVVGEN